jgi:hypothetical protein
MNKLASNKERQIMSEESVSHQYSFNIKIDSVSGEATLENEPTPITQEQEEKLEALPTGKRPGWRQMTIWVPSDLEPQMKLLSQFENESISEMTRTYFQDKIESSPYRDLIKETINKRAKINKKK